MNPEAVTYWLTNHGGMKWASAALFILWMIFCAIRALFAKKQKHPDIGAIAIERIMRDLGDVVNTVDGVGYEDKLGEQIVYHCRGLLVAYTQSVQWHKSRRLKPDGVVTSNVSVCILESMKAVDSGSKWWPEIKSIFDKFYRVSR